MPVIELDMLIAFTNRADRNHSTAVKLFESISSRGSARHKVATSAYMEYELFHRSKGVSETEIFNEISSYQAIPNLGETGLNSHTLLRALLLRQDYGLTYFDSIHGASALLYDGKIVSTDHAYDKVEGLQRLAPQGQTS